MRSSFMGRRRGQQPCNRPSEEKSAGGPHQRNRISNGEDEEREGGDEGFCQVIFLSKTGMN
jgi:hypothetical protein